MRMPARLLAALQTMSPFRSFSTRFWRQVYHVIHPHALLQDLLTQVTCLGDRCCVLPLVLADAFVYACNQQRHCMPGRIRLMTALAPEYAHVYQAFCVGRGPSEALVRNFRLLAPRVRNRQLLRSFGGDSTARPEASSSGWSDPWSRQRRTGPSLVHPNNTQVVLWNFLLPPELVPRGARVRFSFGSQ